MSPHCSLYVTGPLDGLSLRIHVAMYAGAFLASPVILWQVWRFVTPGLRRNEKRYVVPFVAASLVLFAAGASLAVVSLPHALRFLGSVGGPTLQQIYDPNKYVGLVTALMAVFGLTFEFPVVLVALELVGVVSPSKLASWRRWAIVLIVTGAAVITPSGDPFSMLALAVPLYRLLRDLDRPRQGCCDGPRRLRTHRARTPERDHSGPRSAQSVVVVGSADDDDGPCRARSQALIWSATRCTPRPPGPPWPTNRSP